MINSIPNLLETSARCPGIFANILGCLSPKEQIATRLTCKVWDNIYQSNLGLFPRVQSIAGLSKHEVFLLYQDLRSNRTAPFDELFFPVITKKFQETLDPSGKILGRFLSNLHTVMYRIDSQKGWEFFESLPIELKDTILTLDYSSTTITDERLLLVLNSCKNVKTLYLARTAITGDCFSQISVDNQLKNLNLSDCLKLNEEKVASFFSKVKGLEKLDLSVTLISSKTLLALDLSNLQELSLNLSVLNDEEELEIFFRRANSLKNLYLSGSISDRILLAIDPSKLKKFSFHCRGYSEKSLQLFFKRATALEELDLSKTYITGKALLSIKSNLKSLNLTSCLDLNPAILEVFFEKIKPLEALYLGVTSTLVRSLLALDPSKLKILDIQFCKNLDEDTIEDFFEKADSLQELCLEKVPAVNSILKAINPLNLRKLVLNNNRNLNKTTLENFFSKPNALEQLFLSHTNVNTNSLLFLSSPYLKILCLNGCHKLNEQKLGEFFSKTKSLEVFSAKGTSITGDSLLSLNLSNLKALILDRCIDLNQQTLHEFLSKVKSLKTLHLFQTPLTDQTRSILNSIRIQNLIT
ncbi:MAG: hypothetical protein COT84_05470 [Chlamydiae bacterium CG10_big_fil_rev_8_21_14_0_10_35_9]|nr:MAG: hypothetical protein COT84_05470 [Chlamydiae bacterium CG10_big_fil_rev_8_21_14_0_10_35_9]